MSVRFSYCVCQYSSPTVCVSIVLLLCVSTVLLLCVSVWFSYCVCQYSSPTVCVSIVLLLCVSVWFSYCVCQCGSPTVCVSMVLLLCVSMVHLLCQYGSPTVSVRFSYCVSTVLLLCQYGSSTVSVRFSYQPKLKRREAVAKETVVLQSERCEVTDLTRSETVRFHPTVPGSPGEGLATRPPRTSCVRLTEQCYGVSVCRQRRSVHFWRHVLLSVNVCVGRRSYNSLCGEGDQH